MPIPPRCLAHRASPPTAQHARNEPPQLGWLLLIGQGGDVRLFSSLSGSVQESLRLFSFLRWAILQRQQGSHSATCLQLPSLRSPGFLCSPQALVTSGPLSSPAHLRHQTWPSTVSTSPLLASAGPHVTQRPKLISWFLP